MAKRLFSADKRAETILAHLRSQDANLSAYISNSVIDETLPIYSQLRIEALYLLDFITDGAKEWTSNKLVIATEEDAIDFHIRQALGRGVSWLRRNHHIKNCNVLKDILAYYHESSLNGGITIDALNDTIKVEIEIIKKKLAEIDPNQRNIYVGLGALARDVLDHWDVLWNDNDAYNIIISAIYCENLLRRIDPFIAIEMLQAIENQFIIEAIDETNFQR